MAYGLNDCVCAPGVVGDCVIVEVRMRGGLLPPDGVGMSDDLAPVESPCIEGDLFAAGSDE
jgi:hypothetical protein